MSETTDSITLRLEGTRARRGVALSDFATFINSFSAALRELDRDKRGASTRRSGLPEELATLHSLLMSVEREESLPDAVTDALEKAVRSVGDDGSLSVEFSGSDFDHERPTVTIDRARIARIRAVQTRPQAKLVSSTPLFSAEPIPDDDLAVTQGITAPQGLAGLGASSWSEADEAYLAALINK